MLHTHPERLHATREPLQFGAEIYGHAGREADVEILSLALDCLRAAPLAGLSVDLADARIVRALLAGVMADPAVLAEVHHALAAKDASTLARLTRDFPAASREGLQALVGLYGDEEVLVEAEKSLQRTPGVREALSNLKYLASRLEGVRVSFDLADARGYVTMPNVEPVSEMVNMISASRSYQANVEVMNTSKQLMLKTLTLGEV